MNYKILKLPAVMIRTGKSRSAIYAAVAGGDFPKPVLLGKRSVGWVEAEIDAWIEYKIECSRAVPSSVSKNSAPSAAVMT